MEIAVVGACNRGAEKRLTEEVTHDKPIYSNLWSAPDA